MPAFAGMTIDDGVELVEKWLNYVVSWAEISAGTFNFTWKNRHANPLSKISGTAMGQSHLIFHRRFPSHQPSCWRRLAST
jgi:hypothetical protein